jgi:uncharacterized membrane protein YkoI
MKAIHTFFAAAIAMAATAAAVLADQPPADAKPITVIVEQLEKDGYGPFIEVSFDDGYWEVEAYKKDVQYELAVDCRTGKIVSEHRDEAEPRPPRDSQPLSEILRRLSKSGNTAIDEVSFEYRYWEVESRRNDGKHEIQVDPKTGKIINDRLDD